MTAAVLSGYFLSLGLIVAIGAQNAFVLRQGLIQRHVFAVCLVCALSDALLIAAGVAGFGAIVERLPWFETATRLGGALFLFFYAWRSLVSAWQGGARLEAAEEQARSLGAVLATCLAFTYLNPHVYLDTVMLVGSVAQQFEGRKTAFAAGAAAASASFFFALGYGARLAAPLFASPAAWRALDGAIALVMALIGSRLLLGG